MRPESLRTLFIRCGLTLAMIAGLVACTPKGPNGPNGPSPEVAATAIVSTLSASPEGISDANIQQFCDKSGLMIRTFLGEDVSIMCDNIVAQGGNTPPCNNAYATYYPDSGKILVCPDSIIADAERRGNSVEQSFLKNISHELEHGGFSPDLSPDNIELTQIDEDSYFFIADSEIGGYRVSRIFLVYKAYDPVLQREVPVITEATYNFEFFTQLINYAVNIGLDPNTLEIRDPSSITIEKIKALITYDGYLHCSSFSDLEQEAQLDMNARIIKAIIENRYYSENAQDSYAYQILDGLRDGNYLEVFKIYNGIINSVSNQEEDSSISEWVALLGPGSTFCNYSEEELINIPPCLRFAIVLEGNNLEQILAPDFDFSKKIFDYCGYQP